MLNNSATPIDIMKAPVGDQASFILATIQIM